METMRIAAAQAQAAPGDIKANADTVARMIRQAAGEGAALVVFPELFLAGYAVDGDRAVRTDDARLAPIAAACRESGTVAVVGAAVAEQGGPYISALVLGRDGELLTRYDKQFVTRTERAAFRPGKGGRSFELDGWRFGLGVCYDSAFPEHARAAALDGCHAYLVGAAYSVEAYHESRIAFPARAFDNTLYALFANHVGRAGPYDACGSSAVWAPDGRLLSEASPDRPGLALADLDPAALRAVREAAPMLRDVADL